MTEIKRSHASVIYQVSLKIHKFHFMKYLFMVRMEFASNNNAELMKIRRNVGTSFHCTSFQIVSPNGFRSRCTCFEVCLTPT